MLSHKDAGPRGSPALGFIFAAALGVIFLGKVPANSESKIKPEEQMDDR